MRRLLERRFVVRCSRENAWAYLANPEQWPSWARHIRRIDLKPAGPLGPSSTGLLWLTNGIRSRFEVEEFHPERSWKWVGSFLWLTVHYDHQFRRLGPEETEIAFVLDAEGFAVWQIGRMFAASYRRNLDRAIPALIRELERSQLSRLAKRNK
ncbi:MAG TPA: SRPBCC family protein [Pyrinomonadaceae bacterium]|nr:SRPBCC family protein [Pyrinomonadaceae bacterium]